MTAPADNPRATKARERGIVRSATFVVPILRRLLPSVGTVVEIGCGSAAWSSLFARHGVTDVLGVDAARHPQLHIENFLERDLAQPLALERRFDLALCVDCVERLPPDRAVGLVSDLAALSDAIVFCGAAPNTIVEGDNRQWPSWWSRLFAAQGYDCVDCLRPLIWADSRIDWRYAQSLMLFVRRERLADMPELRAAATVPGDMVDLVHPESWRAARP